MTQKQIDAIEAPIASWSKNAEAYLVEKGLVNDRLVAQRLSEYLGCPWLDLDPAKPLHVVQGSPAGDVFALGEISDLVATTHEAVERIPESVFRGRKVVPVRVEDGHLHVVSMDPMDFSAIEEIRMLSGMSVISHVGTQALFKKLALQKNLWVN